VDGKFEPTRRAINRWLAENSKSKYKRVVESPLLASAYRNTLAGTFDIDIVIRDRYGKVIQLRAGRVQDRMIGVSSRRPDEVFELNPNDLLRLTVPSL
jgi:hypothetical protein